MTALFIANCTNQDHEFNFRMPGTGKLISLRIPKGRQEKILGDLSEEEVKGIVSQHEKYGLIHVDEAKKVQGFAGFCYSDKVITTKSMQNLYDHNQEVLEEKGEEQRKQAAVVVQATVDTALGKTGQTTNAIEVENVELHAPEDSNRPGLSETIRVDKRGESENRGGRGRRR